MSSEFFCGVAMVHAKPGEHAQSETRSGQPFSGLSKNTCPSSKFSIVLLHAFHRRQRTMPQKRSTFSLDHDACGVGLIATLRRSPSHEVLERSLVALSRLAHRGG